MFFLCYLPFHLTAPFHTIPRGTESRDMEVHVTVIIFFNRDKDMDSRDSAYSLSSPAPTLILFGDSVPVLDRNEFSQSKVSPYCVQKTLKHTEPCCVCTPKTYTGTHEPRGVRHSSEENSGQMFCFAGLHLLD